MSSHAREPSVAGLTTLPPAVPDGGQIRIITPSARGADISPVRFDRGLAWLRGRGYQVTTGAQLLAAGDYAAGDGAARAHELNDAYADDTVSAIVACIGGYNTNALLRHVDFDLIAANPKPLIGYSDVTALLVAVHCHTGQVTYHGPTLMPELAEWPEPLPETTRWFDAALRADVGAWAYEPPGEWTDQFLPWGVADDRPRKMHDQAGWTWVCSGHAEGVLFGGNLDTLSAIVGTAHLVFPPETLFFWETTDTNLATIDRALTHLEDAGMLAGLRGMVVGKSFRTDDAFERKLTQFVADRYSGLGCPIVTGVDLGHTDPMLTIPIGRRGVLSSGRFEILPFP